MTVIKGKIAPYQLFCLLFLGRVLSTTLYAPSGVGVTGALDAAFGMTCAFFLQLFVLVPMFFLLRKNTGEDFSSVLQNQLGIIGKGIVLVYVIYCLLTATAVTSEIAYFMSNFTRGYDVIVYLAVVCIFAIYVAKFGLQAVARVGFLLFIVLLPVTVLLFSGELLCADFFRIRPFLSDSLLKASGGFLYYSFSNLELTLLPVLAPFIVSKRHGSGKATILSLASGTVFAILTAILSAALLGAYFTKVEYPYFMAIASIELFGFRRFDVLIAYLWFAVAIVRAALFFFSAAHLTDSLFRTPRRKRVFWLLTVCFAASALGIGCSIEVFSGISLFIRSAPVAILFAAVVPGVLLLSRKKGRGKTLEM